MILFGTSCAKYYDTQYPNIYKVSNSQTASGYIINNSIYDEFIKMTDYSIDGLTKTGNSVLYCIDMAWKSFQGENKHVYLFNKTGPVGVQRPSYSDIEKRQVNYGV